MHREYQHCFKQPTCRQKLTAETEGLIATEYDGKFR